MDSDENEMMIDGSSQLLSIEWNSSAMTNQ